MFKRIMIPVDGSELSLKAATAAVNLAKQVNADVIFLHAAAPYVMPYGADYAVIDPTISETLRKNAEAAATELLGEASKIATNAGVKFQCVLEETGRPEVAVEDNVKKLGADLIVIATHGRGAVGRFVMGSVTTRLLSVSPVPVLVFRDGATMSV